MLYVYDKEIEQVFDNENRVSGILSDSQPG